jgi:hypothetical protein
MKVKVENHEELVRDTTNKAVLNTDLSSLEAYRARRDKERQKDEEVKTLKQEIDEIKQVLNLIVEKLT